MITGVVRPSREAIVGLRLRGTNAVEIDVEAVLDTGFRGCQSIHVRDSLLHNIWALATKW
jgi:hypothetical protein